MKHFRSIEKLDTAILYAFLPPKLTRHLSIDQLCKIIVEVGRYCAYRNTVEEEFTREQARTRRTRA